MSVGHHTEELFRQDAYLFQCPATVLAVNDRGGIILDRTVFYPTGGGQPGDSGVLILPDGSEIAIATTVKDRETGEIVHVPAEGASLPAPGTEVTARIDVERRRRLMRVHTAMHIMCALVPFPVTGGQVGEDGGRLDFAIEDASAVDKERLTEEMNRIIAENHPVRAVWITEEELDANPDLVRTMSVKPPRGSGRVRVIEIGENGCIDRQPCGGTHVMHTSEIGRVQVTKMEKKGRLNRRIRFSLLEP
ncbi:alanyl-tRNA editing protein [Thermopetrobacter sp. TC1]|uniref:alanyl-tRNA editing protein n=1 Tax=Thermopetrobacter sp. TC1 TaxID=1495045 RepID=UPI000570BC3F|nr:alanyl-tRNA editing protein [Thermopetrobacter sp. TC1]